MILYTEVFLQAKCTHETHVPESLLTTMIDCNQYLFIRCTDTVTNVAELCGIHECTRTDEETVFHKG